jgi:uncharacterized repeat protein (TIGR01451 family)
VLAASGPPSCTAGAPVTYTFTVTNQGVGEATGVQLEYVVPSATDLNAFEPGRPRCDRQANALTCYLPSPDDAGTVSFTLTITGHGDLPVLLFADLVAPGWPACTLLKEETYLHIAICELGTLQAGQSARAAFNITARALEQRMLVNTASVTAQGLEGDLLEATASLTATVEVAADLALSSQEGAPATGAPVPGVAVTYTLAVVNDGPTSATYAVLTSTLPAGVELLSAVTSEGEMCRRESSATAPGAATCDLGNLSAGEAATVTLVIDAAQAPVPAGARVRVAVAAEQPDPDPADNVLELPLPPGGAP